MSYTYKNRHQAVEAVKNFGKSGSSKITVLPLQAGLDLPSNGKVLYSDISTATMDRDNYCIEDVAVIYQAYYLFPLFTTLENVMHPLELKGVKTKESREKAADIIKRVGLSEEYYRRYPGMLSGGEQQRVAIARPWPLNPRLFLQMSQQAI